MEVGEVHSRELTMRHGLTAKYAKYANGNTRTGKTRAEFHSVFAWFAWFAVQSLVFPFSHPF